MRNDPKKYAVWKYCDSATVQPLTEKSRFVPFTLHWNENI
jgi:hypothetical protein